MGVTEEPIEFHPLFEAYNKDIGPAIRHLDEVRAVSPFFFELLGLVIGSLELIRALSGWKAPNSSTVGRLESDDGVMFQDLNDDYYPGDVGFDPLGLKPTDPDEFAEIHTMKYRMDDLLCWELQVWSCKSLLMEKKYLLAWVFLQTYLIHQHFLSSSRDLFHFILVHSLLASRGIYLALRDVSI